MKDEISSGIKTDLSVFNDVLKGIMENVAPEAIGDLIVYRRLKAFIFSKNRKKENREFLLEELKEALSAYYDEKRRTEIIPFFIGVEIIAAREKIKNETALNQWMELRKIKMKKKLFGGRMENKKQLVF